MNDWRTYSPSMSLLPALVSNIARPSFETDSLQLLNEVIGAASWSVYRIHKLGVPRLHLSSSHGVRDTTQSCFATYRDTGLYRRDRSFSNAETAQRHPVVIRTRPSELVSKRHAREIYDRHSILERISVAGLDADGSILAVNLYRHHHQGFACAAEIGRFATVAPTLFAVVQRHLALLQNAVDADNHQSLYRANLRRVNTDLSRRELDVLDGVLRGLTYLAIATELGVSETTVKTYRARAFTRLGIRSKGELFAKVVLQPCSPELRLS